ncbi:hypothetical protein ACV344_00045 [Pseudomonas aeruginosa]|uniref:hypothetical protein n=1 Tax=Pseudomonas aeruginosa TaxID=287 RepID=UPI000D8450DF|nr:hypothetical protein [Pseudomonas aeruginosa]MBI7769730.1 hypothetical protein [Pseudomonas aeruginosa]MBX6058648.1 hypothetical protein [Pseudomonas aeruginosa]MBX6083658.1 hypothetical protein [Pseudomonas aeruginosa]MBX6153948.1 hypothetical protein [Pseudomonas aeruginosa]MBX6176634.1 hypothetical protein [Pseudomonas aeruginosa]
MSEPVITDINDAVSQINNTLLALARIAAETNPKVAQKHLAIAVLACRQQGVGDNFVLEIFQKVFPDGVIPSTYTLDIPNINRE